MESEHDQAFLQILRDEKNIVNFLDAFFGFLYRCTDFYIASTLEHKLGFPPGMAEKLVLKSMHKWKNASVALKKDVLTVADSSVSQPNDLNLQSDSSIPPVVQEVEIDSCSAQDNTSVSSKRSVKIDQTSDSYNGAVREKYVWTQTLDDLDVLVKIPEYIKTAKQTRVNINSDEIKIDIKSCDCTDDTKWDNALSGKLNSKIRRDESTWSIVSGKHISIHLEKATGKWWEALIVDEPKIELNRIDCAKNFNDMASEEQMKVEELIWNHEQKILGKPTSEQMKLEATLKKAWNAKGSPFQNTPYDPSIVRFN